MLALKHVIRRQPLRIIKRSFSSTEASAAEVEKILTSSSLAESLLKRKDKLQILCVKPTASVREAASEMVNKNCGSVLVMDDDNEVVGIFTERDYLKTANQSISRSSPVADVMVPFSDMVSVTEEDSLYHCMELMSSHGIRHLPVLKGNEAIGVLSVKDIITEMVKDHHTEVERLRSFIQGLY